MQALITVVVPVYNVEKYLKRCVESILNQSYIRLEIILVDDGSTDGSGLLCDDLATRDDRIKVIHKENGGLSDARNAGIDIAKGEFITFIDSDDFVDLDMIETLSDSTLKTGSDIAICGFVPFYESDTPEVSGDTNVIKTLDNKKALSEMMYQKSISNSAWAKLYRLSLFSDDIRYPFGMLCEDLGTTYKLFAKANKITVNSYKGYFYLQREGSILHSKFSLKRLDSLLLAKEQLEFVKIQYPSLVNSAANRYFAEASFLLSEASTIRSHDAGVAREECVKVINQHKRVVLMDGLSRQRFRMFALISIPSAHILSWSFSTKRKIIRLVKSIA